MKSAAIADEVANSSPSKAAVRMSLMIFLRTGLLNEVNGLVLNQPLTVATFSSCIRKKSSNRRPWNIQKFRFLRHNRKNQ